MKSKLLSTCTACSLIAAVIGFIYIGTYIWEWANSDLMETIKLIEMLF